MKSLIVFSGIDSAGKSTQIDLLKKEYTEMNLKNKVVWSRGGYTSGFEIVKKILRFILRKKLPDPGRNSNRQEMFDKKYVTKIWYTFAMLDLIRLYAITFRIYRMFGITVIADRYIWDTYVDFKMSLKNINLDKSILWRLAVKLSPSPYKSVILVVTPEVSFQRSIEKKEPYFDSLEVRKERIEIYNALIKKGLWGIFINTKLNNSLETYKTIKDYTNGV